MSSLRGAAWGLSVGLLTVIGAAAHAGPTEPCPSPVALLGSVHPVELASPQQGGERFAPPPADGAAVQRARELGAVIARAQDTSDELDRLRAERAALRDELDARRGRLQDDLRAIEAELDGLRRAREELESATAEARAARAAADVAFAALVADAREFAARWSARAARGVPSVRADLPRLEAWRADLDAEVGEVRVAAVRELLGDAVEGVLRWRRRTFTSARIRPPGTELEVHAWVLGLGTVGEWFVGERGRHLGAAARDGGQDWRPLGAGGEDARRERVAILRAAERLRGRSGPELGPLPLEAPLFVPGEETPAAGAAGADRDAGRSGPSTTAEGGSDPGVGLRTTGSGRVGGEERP